MIRRAVAVDGRREAISGNQGSSRSVPPGARQLTEAEADHVTELFSLAFYDDPTWSRAFPDPGYSFGRIAAASFFSPASEGGAPAGLTAIRT
jgi:hypothetical protein